jgi:hypothetical protein
MPLPKHLAIALYDYGVELGLAIGKEAALLFVVTQMKKNNMTIEEIKKYIDLDEETILKINEDVFKYVF